MKRLWRTKRSLAARDETSAAIKHQSWQARRPAATARVLAFWCGLLAASAGAQTSPFTSNASVHDPSIVRAGATFYVFGSHLAAASTMDLMNWTQISTSPAAGNALVPNPAVEFQEVLAWAQTNTFWAPDVVQLGDGKYYMYYCACRGDAPRSALGLAVSDAIGGPYTHVAVLLRSGMVGTSDDGTPYNATIHPNVVDPSVFFDQAGKLWMVYGSYSGGIFIMEMDPATGRQKPGQGYGKKLMGGNHARIEGAYILYSPESAYYYFFVSFGGLNAADGYNIRVGRSRNPDGPFRDASGTDLTSVAGAPGTFFDDASIAPHGVKLMGGYQFLHVAGEPQTTSRGYLSPGHNSAYYDSATGKYFLVFHTRFVGRGEQHEVRVHQMFLNADDWLVAAPHRYAQETIATANAAQVAGDYKLINHGKDISGTAKTSTAITLRADGSITGAVTGTWQLSGDHFISLALSGVIYRGVVVPQWDDDNLVWVQAFTVLSDNGTAWWGSKVAALTSDTPPTIATQPLSQSVTAGAAVSFAVVAGGSPPPTFQWRKNGVALSGATGSTYSISQVTTADAGDYTVVVTNTAGAVTSASATLTVNAATSAPGTPAKSGAYASGSNQVTVTWQPPASGLAAAGYRVERATDAAFIAGLTSFTMTDASTSWIDTTAMAGTTYFYRLYATNAAGESAPTEAMEVQTPHSVGAGVSTFIGIATRAHCRTGNNVTIGGFVISGSTPKRVLIRALGPTLTTRGLSAGEVLADPMMEVFDALAGNALVGANDNWGDNVNAAEISAVAESVGVGGLAAGDTQSSALLRVLPPGVYTFVVTGKAASSGVVLLEVYDVDEIAGGSTFTSIATRASATAGNGVAIGGFVIQGPAPKQVLVRAVGPTLVTQGLGASEVLADPVIQLHRGASMIATNDDWADNANAEAIRTTGARVGATPFDAPDTKSSALWLTLPPGAYSFIAQGKNESAGIVLVEVYNAD